MDQNRMIEELLARGYDEDALNSYGVAQLSELHKKEFPDKYAVADNAIQNQDFSKDKETNANLYKLGPKPFAARREFENMEADAASKRAAEGNNDPRTRMDVDKWAFEKVAPVQGTPIAGNAPTLNDSNIPSSSPNNKEKSPNAGIGNLAAPAPGGVSGDSDSDNVNNNKVANYMRRSIYDAWKSGEFGDPNSDDSKMTRNYFIMDTLANFAKDLGAGQANIAAIYNGGKPSEVGTSKSQWDKAQDEMLASQVESKKSGITGSREQRSRDMQDAQIYAQKLNNLSMADRRAMAQTIKKYIDNAPNDTLRLAYSNIYNSMLTDGGVSDRDLGVIAGTEAFNWIKGKLGF